jgi:fructokinase
MRLGVDVGGTKISVAVMAPGGEELVGLRVHYEDRSYDAALTLLSQTIIAAETDAGGRCSVGIGMPGLIDAESGLVENAYNTPFNRQPLKRDLERRLGREVRFANDANCFALSEAIDGAARGAEVVWGAILGTGVGGGLAVQGRVLAGRNGTAGEWGHVPLPWMSPEEYPGPRCNCGRLGCIEQFLSGPAKNRERDQIGEEGAMVRYEDRLARAFAMIVNVVDPDVIVVGGGLSKHDRLFTNVAPLLPRYTYWPKPRTRIVRAMHGDDSGVRGAALLWPSE